MHTMQATCLGALAGSVLGDTQPAQLVKCYESVLTISDSGDFTVHTPPTGLKAIHITALSPVGGGGE